MIGTITDLILAAAIIYNTRAIRYLYGWNKLQAGCIHRLNKWVFK